MEYRSKGYGSVLSGQTTETDIALSAVRPAPSMITAASVVTLALKRISLPVGAVIDARSGKVIATDSATMKAALRAILASAQRKITLRPDNGQSGVVLHWHQHGTATSWDVMDAITPILTASKPKVSAPSLAQSVLGTVLDGFCVIDQAVPEVCFYQFSTDAAAVAASAALSAVSPAGKTIAVELRDVEDATFV